MVLSKRLLSFLHFTWHMAQKDLMHQWRVQKLFTNILPDIESLKQYKPQKSEVLIYKLLLELHEFIEIRQ